MITGIQVDFKPLVYNRETDTQRDSEREREREREKARDTERDKISSLIVIAEAQALATPSRGTTQQRCHDEG